MMRGSTVATGRTVHGPAGPAYDRGHKPRAEAARNFSRAGKDFTARSRPPPGFHVFPRDFAGTPVAPRSSIVTTATFTRDLRFPSALTRLAAALLLVSAAAGLALGARTLYSSEPMRPALIAQDA